MRFARLARHAMPQVCRFWSSQPCLVLAIESSCDDTSVCLYSHPSRRVLYHRVQSQDASHIPYGGIVPHLAAEKHRAHLPTLLKEASQALAATAAEDREQIGLIAVTQGPGLAPALNIGLSAGQALAAWLNVPVVGIHHMEAHLLVPLLNGPAPAGVQFPFLSLLVTGGHTLLVLVQRVGSYKILGQALDDAIGEALDKGSRSLAIPWQVGDGSPAQSMESFIKRGHGNPFAFAFPLPFKKPKHSTLAAVRGSETPRPNAPGLHFSFAGLKTSLQTMIRSLSLLAPEGSIFSGRAASVYEKIQVDLAASYQYALFRHVLDRVNQVSLSGIRDFVVSGGVARNATLLSMLEAFCDERGLRLWRPDRKDLCTDNALMIAFAASERLKAGLLTLPPKSAASQSVLEARPKWSIESID